MTDTRRCIAERSQHERWVARPFDDPNGQEIIILSKAELMHALPCCDDLVQNKQYVTTAALRVRPQPNTQKPHVGVLPQGSVVMAYPVNPEWLRIAAGEYEGRYISSAFTRPT